MTDDVVLLLIQSEVDDRIVRPPHQNVTSVHVPVFKLQRLP